MEKYGRIWQKRVSLGLLAVFADGVEIPMVNIFLGQRIIGP
jgi:hypothetical protein